MTTPWPPTAPLAPRRSPVAPPSSFERVLLMRAVWGRVDPFGPARMLRPRGTAWPVRRRVVRVCPEWPHASDAGPLLATIPERLFAASDFQIPAKDQRAYGRPRLGCFADQRRSGTLSLGVRAGKPVSGGCEAVRSTKFLLAPP